MATHARFSPSKLEDLEICPCYRRIESDEDNEFAQEGTLLHEAAETGDFRKLETEEQVEAAREALMFSDGVCAGALVDKREVRVEVEDLTYGTADRIAFRADEGKLVVCDYKFGRKAVTEAETNLQGMCYGAGGVLWIEKQFPGTVVKTVDVHMICPRQKLVSSHTFTDVAEMVDETKRRIKTVLAAQDDPFKQPKRNAILCDQCQHMTRCPAWTGTAVALAQELTGLPMPASFRPEAMVSLRDRAIGQILKLFFQEWAEQVGKANTEFVATTGVQIPGFDYRERSSGVRLHKDSTLTVREILKQHGLTDDDMMAAATLSFKQLVDVAATKRGATFDETKIWMRGILGEDLTKEGTSRFLQKKSKADLKKLLLAEATKE